jgi:hypothetical protein
VLFSTKFLPLGLLLSAALFGRAAENGKPNLACGTCHTQQARTQPETAMAHAMLLPGSNSVLQQHPMLSVQRGAFTYTVETDGNASTYSVTDGQNKISAPIRYAFGVNSQTWVLERNGQLLESIVSFYPGINGLDTTMGDGDWKPANLEEAFGRTLHPGEYNACFGCHSTNATSEDTLHLASMRPGVNCDRCHANAYEHQQAISQGKLSPLPPRLKQQTSEQISNFCGQCHRSWETVVRDRLFGQVNVRFQPYRLANSKCFNGSDARISCLACHDPHQELVRKLDSYDVKCQACHSSGNEHAGSLRTVSTNSQQRALTAKPCPVGKSDCVGCHMPKVDLPGAHRTFTDHYIRVVRPGETYPE